MYDSDYMKRKPLRENKLAVIFRKDQRVESLKQEIWMLEGAWGKGKVTKFRDELQKLSEN